MEKEKAAAAASFILVIDDTPLAIDAIEGVEGAEKADIYTLSGVRVGKDAKTLAPGVYIINGKKTVVRSR